MFALYDTFNGRILSRHRTIEAAAKADIKFRRAFQRANGKNSYIPTTLRDGEGCELDDEIVEQWTEEVNRQIMGF